MALIAAVLTAATVYASRQVRAKAAIRATALQEVRFAPDIAVTLSGTTVSPYQIGVDNLAGTVKAISFPGIPTDDSVHITGYHLDPKSGMQYFSFDTPVSLPAASGSITANPNDVMSFDGTNYATIFRGPSNSVPDGVAISGMTMNAGNLLLSFDQPVTLPSSPAPITAKPADVVNFDGGVPTIFFDSAANGIPDGVGVDGIHALSSGHLLLSFDQSGSVGGVNFDPEDILEFDPSSGGWLLAYDGEVQHPEWPPGDLKVAYAIEASGPSPSATPTTTQTSPTPTAIGTMGHFDWMAPPVDFPNWPSWPPAV